MISSRQNWMCSGGGGLLFCEKAWECWTSLKYFALLAIFDNRNPNRNTGPANV
jgi:hypothetical protein